jgi:hypothetical protein
LVEAPEAAALMRADDEQICSRCFRQFDQGRVGPAPACLHEHLCIGRAETIVHAGRQFALDGGMQLGRRVGQRSARLESEVPAFIRRPIDVASGDLARAELPEALRPVQRGVRRAGEIDAHENAQHAFAS